MSTRSSLPLSPPSQNPEPASGPSLWPVSAPSSEQALHSPEAFTQLPVELRIQLVRSSPASHASLRERLRILLMLGRPRTCVVGMLCFVLGMEYINSSFTPGMVVGAVMSFLFGFVANIGNTCTDLEEDSRNLPGRVFLLARYGYRPMLWTLAAINAAMLAVSAVVGLYCLLFMVVSLFLVHEYSFRPIRAKSRPLAGLWVFAQVVAFPFFFAAWIEPNLPLLHAVANVLFIPWGEPGSSELVHLAHRVVGMTVFLTVWFLAKGTFKNVPDYHGDRAANLRTSATYFDTWRGAAQAATVATVVAYLSLALLVVLGLEKPTLLLGLLWLVPVTWNCVRLLKTEDGGQGNLYLKTDMVLSMGFISSVLLLLSPRWESVASIVIGALIIFGSDLLAVDSRREADVRKAPAGTASAGS